jgi:hypothetical protein
LYWNQIQPTPDEFNWNAVDAFVTQLEPGDDAWIVLSSSSSWATRKSSVLIPASPALDMDVYYQFVYKAVQRCQGKVKYWQMEFEMSGPIFWQGTAEEYLAQLKIFRRAVSDADPEAKVILAGFLDGEYEMSEALHEAERGRIEFSNYLLEHAKGFFDVLDLHLYHDVYTIPKTMVYFKQKMQEYGYEYPIFVGEYNGPAFVNFAENAAQMPHVMKAMHSMVAAILSPDKDIQIEQDRAEQQAMKELYGRMTSLPPQTQMFMEGCAPELEAKRHRINCREIVMRNMFALSTGASKTCCFNLAPDIAGRPYRVLNLMFNKYKLMDYENGRLEKLNPSAEAFRRMTQTLSGMVSVRQVENATNPKLCLFEVTRHEKNPVFVAWERRDSFSGEDLPLVSYDLPGNYAGAKALDVFGKRVSTSFNDNRLTITLGSDPVFIEMA